MDCILISVYKSLLFCFDENSTVRSSQWGCNQPNQPKGKVEFHFFFLIEPKIHSHFIPLIHLQAAPSARRAAHIPGLAPRSLFLLNPHQTELEPSRVTCSSSGGSSNSACGLINRHQPPSHPNKEAVTVWLQFPAIIPFSPKTCMSVSGICCVCDPVSQGCPYLQAHLSPWCPCTHILSISLIRLYCL